MKPNYLLVVLLTIIGLYSACYGQNGQYDVRFKISEFSCHQAQLFVDIEVRAESSTSTFSISDQNYRFSFNPLALSNPTIFNELTFSGLVQTTSPPSTSFYSSHTLVGSLGSVVSYNVEMQGGDGYPLNAIDYVPVGRIRFDILDANACLDLYMHTKQISDFPPTLISEVSNNVPYTVDEGSYGHYMHCLLNPCDNDPPVARDDYFSTVQDSAISYNIVANDYDYFGNLDYASLRLLSTPSASEGMASIDTASGTLLFAPGPSFVGSVPPFYYEVCDGGTTIPSTVGYHNTSLPSLPVPADSIYFLEGSKCAIAAIYITVTAPVMDPDLSPVITVIPANLQGVSTLGVAVNINELEGHATSSAVFVRIPKDPRLLFIWDPSLTFVAFNSVDNANWQYSSTPNFHQFLYAGIVSGFSVRSFGFVATYDPQNTQGQTTITATIVPFSGGEKLLSNNVDSEIIIYFD